MPDAKILLVVATLMLAACGKQATDGNHADNVAADGNVEAGAEIETLPADESSTTPSSELQNGVGTTEGNGSLGNGQ